MKLNVVAVYAGLLAGALVISSGSDALACRGTDEYPKLHAKLAASKLPEALKAPLFLEYQKGKALHDAGHEENDREKLKKSLEILDEINKQLR